MLSIRYRGYAEIKRKLKFLKQAIMYYYNNVFKMIKVTLLISCICFITSSRGQSLDLEKFKKSIDTLIVNTKNKPKLENCVIIDDIKLNGNIEHVIDTVYVLNTNNMPSSYKGKEYFIENNRIKTGVSYIGCPTVTDFYYTSNHSMPDSIICRMYSTFGEVIKKPYKYSENYFDEDGYVYKKIVYDDKYLRLILYNYDTLGRKVDVYYNIINKNNLQYDLNKNISHVHYEYKSNVGKNGKYYFYEDKELISIREYVNGEVIFDNDKHKYKYDDKNNWIIETSDDKNNRSIPYMEYRRSIKYKK